MLGISFLRIIRTALQNMLRNIWLSVATLIIMVITLLMLSFFSIANIAGSELLTTIQSQVDLLVNFKTNVQDQYIQAIAEELKTREDVQSVRVVGSEEALSNFRAKHANDPTLEDSLQALEDNPLYASIYILATDPRFYENITKHLQSEKYTPYIQEVKYEESEVAFTRLSTFLTTTKNIAVVVTAIFSSLVVMIMFNTVRLAIYSFREEIDIMRLVGASRWYIQGPFVIEAIIVATLAVLVTVAIQYPALKFAAPYMQSYFFNSQSQPFNVYEYAVSHWPSFVGIQILFAIALAFFSSLVAVRRYLRD